MVAPLPWVGWTLHGTFAATWWWLERPDGEYDAHYLLAGEADFLRWDESEAGKWRLSGDAPEQQVPRGRSSRARPC